MKRLVVLLVLATLILVTLGASQIQKGSYTSAKQRKPSLPKKYLVEDGGYIKHRKVRRRLQLSRNTDFPGALSNGNCWRFISQFLP